MTAITYKGYYAGIEFDPVDRILTGRLAGINEIVTFEAETADGIIEAFKRAVDDYLSDCARAGKKPARPFSGRVSARFDPVLHEEVVRAAEMVGMTVNQLLEEGARRMVTQILENAAPV